MKNSFALVLFSEWEWFEICSRTTRSVSSGSSPEMPAGLEDRTLQRGRKALVVQSRNTRQKDAIRSAFLGADRPLSPEEALHYARELVEGVSIATVYRNIGTLVEENWLTSIALPGETARYEVAGKEHHHHFRCNQCRKIFEMPGCSVQFKPNLPKGFQVTGHEFFLSGNCAACR